MTDLSSVMPALFRGPRRSDFSGMMDREPCVDILANGFNGALYTGVTPNLIGRIMQHRDGKFDGLTRRYDIKRLVRYEIGDTVEVAIATEKRIKKWRRQWKMNAIERDDPHRDDLAVAFGLPPLKR
jgi:putative endonuclease